jgi:hypothetical protein
MGTESFWIPAAIAAVGGGAEYVNQRNANNRQQDATVKGIQDQARIQSEAAGKASALTRQIAASNPNKIAGTATGAYVDQLRRNASAPGSSAIAPSVIGSSRYKSGVDQSAQNVANFGNTNASEMGNIDAAVRQRQNEGLAMQDLGTDLNGLGAKSYTTNFVDQLRQQQAGTANPWVSLFAGMLKNYGLSAAGGAASKGSSLFGGAGKAASSAGGGALDAGSGLLKTAGSLA